MPARQIINRADNLIHYYPDGYLLYVYTCSILFIFQRYLRPESLEIDPPGRSIILSLDCDCGPQVDPKTPGIINRAASPLPKFLSKRPQPCGTNHTLEYNACTRDSKKS